MAGERRVVLFLTDEQVACIAVSLRRTSTHEDVPASRGVMMRRLAGYVMETARRSKTVNGLGLEKS